jgi:hypothetical protein
MVTTCAIVIVRAMSCHQIHRIAFGDGGQSIAVLIPVALTHPISFAFIQPSSKSGGRWLKPVLPVVRHIVPAFKTAGKPDQNHPPHPMTILITTSSFLLSAAGLIHRLGTSVT